MKERILAVAISLVLAAALWFGLRGMFEEIRKAMGYPNGGHRLDEFPCQFEDVHCEENLYDIFMGM